ncbi:uncharacterized protein LOC128254690 [Drosophila gunungcola]|uniref:DDE Tnp4 domain-containing protein n=1 Tax=Drosophila gunungcola TaxID=103775 RepID=A0A9P9YLE6_9MUSC|nr:uncharacterized protein LOC128254690 [Drosophila gunungcola]KAI8038738.1 hypothetical protein M5D96_008646 [Drosophila gunungcola]
MDILLLKRIETNAIMAAVATALLINDKDNKKRPRSCWVNPFLKERSKKGRFSTHFENLKQSPSTFFENFHMSFALFQELCSKMEPSLAPKVFSRPDSIRPHEKLALVLEYLASGDNQSHIASSYRISKQRIGPIIESVCVELCKQLKHEMPAWTKELMLKSAEDFENIWCFPNCVGAIDGKHVSIKAPARSGCEFNSNKGNHSLVIMAVSDAKYRFTYLDIEAYGSESDINAFTHCKLGKAILLDQLNFPDDKPRNEVMLPYYLVADDAFPLSKRIMKPYTSKNLTRKELVFNNRLGRARRVVDRAFGILSLKWKAVHRTNLCHPDRTKNIITACCLLHNYVLRRSPMEYEVSQHKVLDSLPEEFIQFRDRVQDYPKYVRDNVKDFVNSFEGT